ncbi:MAG: type III-B CRISPR module RAMP protein Cmr4 [Sphingobacteriales bacterium]|nr:type III-B CRISPR module RAMP protein Cmr4 [Sphingobacteriales bacterium]
MKYHFFVLRSLTNMHVGSGQSSYGIVDNIVQRDPLTNYPIIHSSSIKGAFRVWAEAQKVKEADINTIFGNKNNGNDDTSSRQPGSHIFFPARLLSYPMRSNMAHYFNVTSTEILKELNEDLQRFKVDLNHIKIQTDVSVEKNKPITDDISLQGANIESHLIVLQQQQHNISAADILGNKLVLMHSDNFKEIVSRLPIISRNHLENGMSKNLFYEEVVPRQSYFGFFIAAEQLHDIFKSNEPIQIGANATVGYGFCELKQISSPQNSQA